LADKGEIEKRPKDEEQGDHAGGKSVKRLDSKKAGEKTSPVYRGDRVRFRAPH
jgi:hypothetical protein